MGACRPEINVRDTAFKRGTAYLERYCLLIAFTSFLERTKGSDITFQASSSHYACFCNFSVAVIVLTAQTPISV